MQLNSMETAKQQGRLFAVLKQGSQALQQLQQEVKLEDVEQLMADTAEAKAYEDQIRQLIGEEL
jgi:charged multivesicular body protein 6